MLSWRLRLAYLGALVLWWRTWLGDLWGCYCQVGDRSFIASFDATTPPCSTPLLVLVIVNALSNIDFLEAAIRTLPRDFKFQMSA